MKYFRIRAIMVRLGLGTDSAMTATDWQPSAAYLYILHLDSIALAWEYLRRNRCYCREWEEFGRQHPAHDARNWGLQFRRGSFARFARRAALLGAHSLDHRTDYATH